MSSNTGVINVLSKLAAELALISLKAEADHGAVTSNLRVSLAEKSSGVIPCALNDSYSINDLSADLAAMSDDADTDLEEYSGSTHPVFTSTLYNDTDVYAYSYDNKYKPVLDEEVDTGISSVLVEDDVVEVYMNGKKIVITVSDV